MSVEFHNAFNPRDSDFLDFLTDEKTQPGSSIILRPADVMTSMGMDDCGFRAEPGNRRFTLEHACRLHCALIENGAAVGSFTVTVPAKSEVDVNSSTRLGIKTPAQDAHAQVIQKAFFAYAFPADGPLPAYITKVAVESGLALSVYGLFFENICTLVSRTFDAVAITDWIHGYPTSGDNRTDFRIESTEWLSDYPAPPRNPNALNPPSLADAEQAVKDAYDQAVQKNDCAGMATTIPPIEIKRLRLPNEHKVVWKWAYIKNDCGGGFHFWKPVKYEREANAVLFATGSYPGNLEGAKTTIKRILEESALAAAFYALVNRDIEVGLTVFKELFFKKMEEAFGEVQRCLSAEIYVATVCGEWHT